MNFARDLKPDKNLKNDGDLTAMRQWKQSMIRYTNYIRRDCEMTPELYFDVFSNLCDQDMRLKLESIKGVREMGEEKLWDIIEGIWKETNPTYMRRIKAIEMEMEKGELSGDFFTRLKLEYTEAGWNE